MTKPLSYIRQLVIALIISATFNIILLSVILYGFFSDRPPIPYCELKPASLQEQLTPLAIDHSNYDVIRYFKKMSFEWLVERLNNQELVENGYTQRDLALASLMSFHYFDVGRVLSPSVFNGEKRLLAYGKTKDGRTTELPVYLGISDQQYAAMHRFAMTEQWPLTSQGLFVSLRKQVKGMRDQGLERAFFMTPEFLIVELLFSRSPIIPNKSELLEVLLEGPWSLLMQFVSQQKIAQDLSAARRQQFLLDYVQARSTAAALLLLKMDAHFVVSKLDDRRVIEILELLDQKTEEGNAFVLALIASPRSNAVWEVASKRLYEYAGEILPAEHGHERVLARFAPGMMASKIHPITAAPLASSVVNIPLVPSPVIKSKQETSIQSSSVKFNEKEKMDLKPKERLYVIQPGDSLWKLSRRFDVNMEELRAYNHLTSPLLHPGSHLKIPPKKDR